MSQETEWQSFKVTSGIEYGAPKCFIARIRFVSNVRWSCQLLNARISNFMKQNLRQWTLHYAGPFHLLGWTRLGTEPETSRLVRALSPYVERPELEERVVIISFHSFRRGRVTTRQSSRSPQLISGWKETA